MTAEPDEQFDAVCTLLRSPRRRHLLTTLFERECGTLEELVRQIAARESGESDASLDADYREEITISLVHNHLPRLADHGVVEYDARNGDIVLSEGGIDLEPFLEQFGPSTDGPSATHGSPSSVSGTDQEC